MNTIQVSQKVRMIRASSGLTQKQLSEKVEISFHTLRKIEKGEISPTIEILNKICKVCNFKLNVEIQES